VPVTVDEWHTYGVEWKETSVVFFVDGMIYHEFVNDGEGSESWPFDRPFYLILNIAVGGNWGGIGGVDAEKFKVDGQIMEVAWVRVYSNG